MKIGYREFGGWRYWSKGGSFYLSLGTELNWFHLEVGPLNITVARRHKKGS